MTEHTMAAGPTHRSVEIGVALATAAFALIVMGGSIQAGIGWSVEGPRAGFFPFYVGLLILLASIINLVQAFAIVPRNRRFAEWGQLAQVVSVVIPTAFYVALIPYIGIYLASAVLIAVFMAWLGRYSWMPVLAISISVPVVTFAIFEKWFLVALPKGPIEELLGF
jgi:putative tricarboxylic transport membrane protein